MTIATGTAEHLLKALSGEVFLRPRCFGLLPSEREYATETELAALPVHVLRRMKARLDEGKEVGYPYQELITCQWHCFRPMYHISLGESVCGKCGHIVEHSVVG